MKFEIVNCEIEIVSLTFLRINLRISLKIRTIPKIHGLQYIDNQAYKKETLPRMVKPPVLQCKDNTILSEMQMREKGGEGGSEVRICDTSRWWLGNNCVRNLFVLHRGAQ